jgi:ABC-type nitrate/sulfonate/bicarbonate transport system substrate-binding protein
MMLRPDPYIADKNMKIDRRFKYLALLSLLLVLIVGCGTKTPEKVQKMVIGATLVPHAAPVFIAASQAYFMEEGLDVEIREFDSGRTALRRMLNEEGIDIVTPGSLPVVDNSFHRNDYAIIGIISWANNDMKLLVRRDKGIITPSDLKGKTIGMTRGSAGHFFMGLFLANNRLRISDVVTVDLEATRLPQALIEGRVDAISTWEPHIQEARQILGEKVLLLSSRDIYRDDIYLVARKDFIGINPEAVRRFLRAIEKGEAFIKKNSKKAMDIVGKRLKMDQDPLSVVWGDLKFELFLDQFILMSLEDEARWAIRNKLTPQTKVPNYLDYIHTDALKSVKPEAVRVAGK